ARYTRAVAGDGGAGHPSAAGAPRAPGGGGGRAAGGAEVTAVRGTGRAGRAVTGPDRGGGLWRRGRSRASAGAGGSVRGGNPRCRAADRRARLLAAGLAGEPPVTGDRRSGSQSVSPVETAAGRVEIGPGPV